MDLPSILLIALGLSMDAFAVSISAAMVIRSLRVRHIIRASFSFGAFQFLMPVLGWLVGQSFEEIIRDYDHWLAFGLLALIASRMIWGAFHSEGSDNSSVDITRRSPLLALSVATSIDALAVGLSLAFLGTRIIYPSLIIGVVTFLICMLGFYIGKRASRLLETRLERGMEMIGGLNLLAIGVRILVSHLFS